eukprot:Hpha_TRINITY_DN579_c0_g1::TRINITY_DN579_c0_g1_i1::g.171797::m.171797
MRLLVRVVLRRPAVRLQSRSALSPPVVRIARKLNQDPNEVNDADVIGDPGSNVRVRKTAYAGDPTRIPIGYVQSDGSVRPMERGAIVGSVVAMWNTSANRCEIVREVLGIRMTVWVKGGNYIASHLSDPEGMAPFWDQERIDEDGGCMVQPELGRIPGESAEPATLSAAVSYLLLYDPAKGLGDASLPEWLQRQEDVEQQAEVNLKQRRVAVLILLVLGLEIWWYNWQKHQMTVAEHNRRLENESFGGPEVSLE